MLHLLTCLGELGRRLACTALRVGKGDVSSRASSGNDSSAETYPPSLHSAAPYRPQAQPTPSFFLSEAPMMDGHGPRRGEVSRSYREPS